MTNQQPQASSNPVWLDRTIKIDVSMEMAAIERVTYIDAYTDAIEGKLPKYTDKYLKETVVEKLGE